MKKSFLSTLIILSFFLNLQGQYSFPYSITPTLDNPEFLASTDIDGDGFEDMIGSSTDNEKVFWAHYVENGDYFDYPVYIPFPDASPGLILGSDIDQNGRNDLIVFDDTGRNIYLIENINQQGNFSLPQLLGTHPQGIEIFSIADINDDGIEDIVFTSQPNETIYAFISNGSISYSEVVIFSSFDEIRKIKILDIDQDGKIDIAISKDEGIAWFKNLGDGTFTEIDGPNFYSLNILDFEFADLDNDGDLDLIFATSFVMRYHENLGDEIFASNQNITTSLDNDPTDIHLTDINNDNLLDIFLVSGNTEVRRYINNGDFDFSLSGEYTPEVFTKDLFIVDLDQDHIPSFFGNVTSLSNRVYLFDEQLQLDTTIFDFSFTPARAINIADINNNGEEDLVLLGYQGFLYYLSDENAYNSQNRSNYVANPTFPIEVPKALETIDLDLDGDKDIIACGNSGIVLFKNEGNTEPFPAHPTQFYESSFITHHSDLVTGDLNGDLYPDIVFDDGGEVFVSINDGTGNFPEYFPVHNQNSGSSNQVFKLGDIDNDGDLDIVFINTNGFASGLGWLENTDGNGNFGARILIDDDLESPNLAIADLDNDGDLDLVAANGNIFWYENQGAASTNFSNPNFVAPGEWVRTGDIDNNGWIDILSAQSNNNPLLTWIPNSNASFGAPNIIEDGFGALQSLHLGDIDNDEDLDIYFSILQGDYKLNYYENQTIDLLPLLKVQTFVDENEDGLFNNGESILGQQNISITPNILSNWTSSNGSSFFRLTPDNYTVSWQAQEGWTSTTNSEFAVDITAETNEECVAIGLTPTENIFLNTELDITSAPTRCGFEVPFWFSFRSTSNMTTTGVAKITLDTLVTFLTASISPDSISENCLFWFVDQFIPFTSQTISLQLQMPGVEYLGTALSFTASFVQETGDNNQINEVDYLPELNCAYDPNDKLVIPNNIGPVEYTLFGDTLFYTIRFQNTGTDTAFNIQIEDQLNNNLDLSSFKLRSASHQTRVILDQNRLATFYFDNIQLPDSTTNELLSHGYVKFSILPKPDLPEETIIENEAGIFFDFNPPIITNTTTNILVSEYPFSVFEIPPSCFGFADGSLSVIFPFDSLNYQWSTGDTSSTLVNLAGGDYTLTVTDTTGEIISVTSLSFSAPDPIMLNGTVLPEINSQQNGSIEIAPTGGTPPYTYLWNNGLNTSTITNLTTNTYDVTVTDSNLCQQQASFLVDNLVNTTSISGVNQWYISPNPSANYTQVSIQLQHPLEWSISISDLNGKIIQEINRKNNSSLNIDIPISGLTAGIYLVQLKSPHGQLVKKLIITN